MSTVPDKPQFVAYEGPSSPDAERHGPYQLVRHEQGVTITCAHWALWGLWRKVALGLMFAGFVLVVATSCAFGTISVHLGPRTRIDGPWAAKVGFGLFGLALLMWLTLRVVYGNRCLRVTIYAGPRELIIRQENPDGTVAAQRWAASEIESVTIDDELVVRPLTGRAARVTLPKDDPPSAMWLLSALREALGLSQPAA